MRISKPATVAAVTALLAATVAAAPPGKATASGCPARWALLPGSSLSPSWSRRPFGLVNSVSALSPGDAWFAGTYGNGDEESPGAWHWNGRSVAATPRLIPAIPRSIDQLTGLSTAWEGLGQGPGSFDSSADGWVLTPIEYTAGAAPFVTGFGTAEHWAGGRWIMTPTAVSPHPATVGVRLYSVAALSPADAWAVGGFFREGPGLNPFGSPIGALIEHWDGTSWQIVPNPLSAQPTTKLLALTAVSPTDIWAVGYQPGGINFAPLVEHWDGSRWSVVPAPAGNQLSYLIAVSAAGGQVWAVGAQVERGLADAATVLVEHWDGKTWHVQQIPGAGNSQLNTVYAASAGSVWAGGLFAGRNVLLHWNGQAWNTVPVPAPQAFSTNYDVQAIGGTGPGDVWVTGVTGFNLNVRFLIHFRCG